MLTNVINQRKSPCGSTNHGWHWRWYSLVKLRKVKAATEDKVKAKSQQCLRFNTLYTLQIYTYTHTHTRLTALCPGLPRWAGTRKVKTNLDFTEARDSEWQWHQLGHMQLWISLQTDNHASTPPLSFYRPDALPAAQPTASKHWRHVTQTNDNDNALLSHHQLQDCLL